MTQEEKKLELLTIRSHLVTVMEDCIGYRNRLEEIRCSAEAKRLDTIAGKLYDLLLRLKDKNK